MPVNAHTCKIIQRHQPFLGAMFGLHLEPRDLIDGAQVLSPSCVQQSRFIQLNWVEDVRISSYFDLLNKIKLHNFSTKTHNVCTYMYVCMYVCMIITNNIKSKDQPGKAANPARGQLNREYEYLPVLVRA